MIDTDKAIQELAEGDSFTEEQARRIVRIVARADERAATAQDLERVLSALQGDLERAKDALEDDLERLRTDLSADIDSLRSDTNAGLAQLETRMTNRVFAAVGALAALLAVFEFLV